MLGDDAHIRELIQTKPDVMLWTMLERFLQVTRAEAINPEGDWLTPVALRSVGPLHVFSVYPHDPMKDPVLVNIFYGEDGRTKPFKVNRDQDDRLALLKIAPDNTARVIWKKHPREWMMSILACLALRIDSPADGAELNVRSAA